LEVFDRGEKKMITKEAETLTQQRLLEILEKAYRRGAEEADTKKLVEEIATSLKPYVKPVSK
jgi:fructosamine-3-kinase